ncbi:hypothetical protein LELG_03444 [Lodderomyces elongisporus NRRL YB-4239]|uniref:diphosphoinositol-polyphosphate diphosphatase n=1 Tax=Lodderomyces elongisporus (strain ATCC 11503 / CBS 2605 / JCM 1781 / NBRC 1676 / NRRL YB-4239) TaxID=379508 RepID=A5E1F7_LODEL|nr:hypothetical protein LELG_03444 [Lodderomyces elongisporus NRRL YB-4239]
MSDIIEDPFQMDDDFAILPNQLKDNTTSTTPIIIPDTSKEGEKQVNCDTKVMPVRYSTPESIQEDNEYIQSRLQQLNVEAKENRIEVNSAGKELGEVEDKGEDKLEEEYDEDADDKLDVNLQKQLQEEYARKFEKMKLNYGEPPLLPSQDSHLQQQQQQHHHQNQLRLLQKREPDAQSTLADTFTKTITNTQQFQFDIDEDEPLTPPENFALVINAIYRSSFPQPTNFSFLKLLKLKSVLCLIPEDYPLLQEQFLASQGIKLFQLPMSGNKEPFVKISSDLITQAIQIVLDPSNQPILIHCNRGKHRTGCLVGVLRRLQNWSKTIIFDEYRKFAAPKERPMDQQFIELYDDREIKRYCYERGLLPLRWG